LITADATFAVRAPNAFGKAADLSGG